MFETWDKNYESLSFDQLEWAYDNNITVEECQTGMGGYYLKPKTGLQIHYYLYVPHRETMNSDARLMRKNLDSTVTWVHNVHDIDKAIENIFKVKNV